MVMIDIYRNELSIFFLSLLCFTTGLRTSFGHIEQSRMQRYLQFKGHAHGCFVTHPFTPVIDCWSLSAIRFRDCCNRMSKISFAVKPLRAFWPSCAWRQRSSAHPHCAGMDTLLFLCVFMHDATEYPYSAAALNPLFLYYRTYSNEN